MILMYDKATFKILSTIPIDSNPAFYQTWSPNLGVYAVTPDDNTVLRTPQMYYVVETMGVPTGTALNQVIAISMVSTTVDMSDQPVVTFQLTDQAGVPVAQSGVVISLQVDNGALTVPTVTTDGSGTATVIYKPSKNGAAKITAKAPKHYDNGLVITINNTPATPAEQNWIESDDIKPSTISVEKLDPSVIQLVSNNPATAFETSAYYVSQFTPDIGLAKLHLFDDAGFLYVYGNVDPAGTGNNAIKQTDKASGAIIDSLVFSGGATDGISYSWGYDGRSIWAGYKNSGAIHNKLIRIKASDLTIEAIYTIAGIVDIKGVMCANGYVWAYDDGATNRLLQINPSDASIANSLTLPSSTYATTYEFTHNSTHIFMGVESGLINDILRVEMATMTGVLMGYVDPNVAVMTITNVICDDVNIFFSSSSSATSLVKMRISDSAVLYHLNRNADGGTTGLRSDGSNIWVNIGTATTNDGRYLKKLLPADLTVKQSFDVGGSVNNPALGGIIIDSSNLYTLNILPVESGI